MALLSLTLFTRYQQSVSRIRNLILVLLLTSKISVTPIHQSPASGSVPRFTVHTRLLSISIPFIISCFVEEYLDFSLPLSSLFRCSTMWIIIGYQKIRLLYSFRNFSPQHVEITKSNIIYDGSVANNTGRFNAFRMLCEDLSVYASPSSSAYPGCRSSTFFLVEYTLQVHCQTFSLTSRASSKFGL